MSFFRSFNINTKETPADYGQAQPNSCYNIQQWPYYRDLAIQSGHSAISSELASLRYSRLERSLYNLVYTPNDELDQFILYLDSRSFAPHLQFILEVNNFEKVIRENSIDDQQTIALTLFHKYLSIDAKYFLPINDEIRRTTLLLICPSDESSQPDPNCFQMAREYIWQLIERSEYQTYLQSSFHIKYQLKIVKGNQLQLHDFLYHKPSLSYLIEFAERENIIDLVRFWIDVEQFYHNITNRELNDQILVENALSIYDQYISMQAPARLGFDDAIRTKIECSICQPDRTIGPLVDTFDQAVWMIYTILQQEYFPRFLRSVSFHRYTNDLMIRLKHNDCVTSFQRKKSNDFDSISVELENVPQATSFGHQTGITKSSSCSNINDEIEAKSKGRLSMGYVDSLGRFIRDHDVTSTDISSTPNRKPYSKPLQFFTHLVRNEPDSMVTEEDAARFAATLINEITNRTVNIDTD
ncbi:unnamed protein product [Adineta ricciae]|uniref:RGS domain-containing protein n=1 Tax=Adineta ricciae TaxID=249248 RepID=A0A815L636_ADIRI|nr:unnamed protein product [Adineta ricciae]CAF1400035.1 unnamed protein product [Adineta ricciae]